jgi:hypothetical protein
MNQMSRRREMSRLAISFLALMLAFASASGGAFAQTTPDQKSKSKMEQTGEKKMKSSEDPSSPAMQQAAAKKAGCKKLANAKNLTGYERTTFMAGCTK